MQKSSLLARAARSLLQIAGPSPAGACPQQQQQLQRGMSVIVSVHRNNVDQALATLNKRCKVAGLPEELRKRDHHISHQEAKYAAARRRYNGEMGSMIRDRLKWIMKRRKAR